MRAGDGRRRPRILAIGLYVDGIGLTRVMREITSRLVDAYDIDWLGIAYKGEPTLDGGVRVHPTNPRGGDVFAAHQARAMIEADPPDIVFLLHDLWIFENFSQVFAPLRRRAAFATPRG